MKNKRLFLEGDMKIGKSTIIMQNIKSKFHNNQVCGFMCQRLVHNEETIAFCLTAIDKVESAINISSKKLLVLDEIGGFELLAKQFRAKLYEVLSQDIPIIGVIKSNKNKSIMKKAVKINDEYIDLYQKLYSDIENVFNGTILPSHKNNMMYVNNKVNTFFEEVLEN